MSKKNLKEMSFLDHLEELRWLLVRSTIAVIIMATVTYFLSDYIFDVGANKGDYSVELIKAGITGKLFLIDPIIKNLRIAKQKILNFEGFFYLDSPIEDGKKIINRLNQYSVYPKEELLPINWYQLKGSSLSGVYSQLKENNVYIYKMLDGKSHKMRIKNKK